jgi:hypothetical protein
MKQEFEYLKGMDGDKNMADPRGRGERIHGVRLSNEFLTPR